MDDVGGVERMAGALVLEPPVGDLAEIVVDQGDEPVEGLIVPVGAGRKELGHLARLGGGI